MKKIFLPLILLVILSIQVKAQMAVITASDQSTIEKNLSDTQERIKKLQEELSNVAFYQQNISKFKNVYDIMSQTLCNMDNLKLYTKKIENLKINNCFYSAQIQIYSVQIETSLFTVVSVMKDVSDKQVSSKSEKLLNAIDAFRRTQEGMHNLNNELMQVFHSLENDQKGKISNFKNTYKATTF